MITILEIIKNVVFRKKNKSDSEEDDNQSQESVEKAPVMPGVCSIDTENKLKSTDIQTDSKYMSRLDQYIKQKFEEVKKDEEIEKN